MIVITSLNFFICVCIYIFLQKLTFRYNIITIPPVVRNDYIFALQEAQLKNNVQPFINFISEMVLEAQKEYLRIIERLS